MPQAQRVHCLPKNEAVAVLEEMLALSKSSEPTSIVVVVQFASGKHHIGAAGQYLHDQEAADSALTGLDDYLTWGRTYLESH